MCFHMLCSTVEAAGSKSHTYCYFTTVSGSRALSYGAHGPFGPAPDLRSVINGGRIDLGSDGFKVELGSCVSDVAL